MRPELSEIALKIDAALAAFKEAPTPNAATASEYHARFNRLVKRAQGDPSKLNHVAAATSNIRTYFGNRAAIAWACWNGLTKAKAIIESPSESDEARLGAGEAGAWCIAAMESINQGCPIVQRAERRSKRKSLRGLPDDWRFRLVDRLTAHHVDAYFVTALSGCRPCELKKGVKLERTDAVLRVTIQGAKVTMYGGHKERRHEWDLAAGESLRAGSPSSHGRRPHDGREVHERVLSCHHGRRKKDLALSQCPVCLFATPRDFRRPEGGRLE